MGNETPAGPKPPIAAPAPARPAAPAAPITKPLLPAATPARPAQAARPAPAGAAPAPTAAQPAVVLEDPGHPFEAFLGKKFEELVRAMNAEGARLKIPPMGQAKIFVTMLTIRVAAYGVRAGISRTDVLKVLDHFWAMQPAQPRPPASPAGR